MDGSLVRTALNLGERVLVERVTVIVRDLIAKDPDIRAAIRELVRENGAPAVPPEPPASRIHDLSNPKEE